MKPVTIAPIAKDASRLSIVLPPNDLAALRDLANRHRTSPAAIAQLAVKQLLAHVKAGASPLVAPFSLDDISECESIKLN